jgi:hypothetical protein
MPTLPTQNPVVPAPTPIKMTRAEYQAKYGVAPEVPTPVQSEPIKMTRAEYQAKYGVAPDTTQKPTLPTNDTQEPGIIQSVVQGISKPFLKMASSVSNVGANTIGIGAKLVGADNAANKIFASADQQAKEGTDYGYFGKVRPLGQTGSPVGDLKEAVGTGLDLGATLASGGVGAAKGIGMKALQYGTLGAVQGAGVSLENNNKLSTVAKDAFASGLAGGALGALTGGLSKGIRTVSEKAPEAIYNTTLRVTNKLKTAGRSPSSFLVDKGIWGNLGTFKKAATEGMQNAEQAIASKLQKVSGGMTYGEIKQMAVDNLQKELGKDLYSSKAITEMIDSVPSEKLKQTGILNWTDLNSVRSQLGKLIGDSAWLRTNPTEKVKAAQAMYRALASSIQKSSGTAKEFAQYSKWIQTAKVVDRAINYADSKFGLGLVDMVSGGAGAVYGGSTGEGVGNKLKRAAEFGLLGIAGRRLEQNPTIKTGAAQLISKIGQLEPDVTGRVSRTAVIKLIGDLFSTTDSTANRQ